LQLLISVSFIFWMGKGKILLEKAVDDEQWRVYAWRETLGIDGKIEGGGLPIPVSRSALSRPAVAGSAS
jgi:hypothetical protein